MYMCIYLYSFSNNENTEPSDEPDQIVVEKETKRQLWVDQYSPHHFTELLSDDVCNTTEGLPYRVVEHSKPPTFLKTL